MLYTLDMGFDVFEKRPELSQTLAYTLARGLCESTADWLLCDFSDGAKKYSAAEILAAAVALSRRI